MTKLIDHIEIEYYTGHRGIAMDTNERLDKIRKYHEKNPKTSYNQLICFVPETKYMVNKYFKTRSVNNGEN